MKKLIYQYESVTEIYNEETEELEKQPILIDTVIENPTEQDIEGAKQKACNGEYTIEDDGVEVEPTDTERIGELEAALDLLLSGVTE